MKLTKNKLLTALMFVGLVACGRGKNAPPKLSEDVSATDKNLVDVDEGSPSIDDQSQSNENYVIAASVAGVGIGRALMLWAPKKVEALRKFFLTVDQNEAMKINDKLLELVRARKNYEQIRTSLPAQINEALEGNINGLESEQIKSKVSGLLARRARQLHEISSLQIQIANLQVTNWYDKYHVTTEVEHNKQASITRLQKDLSLSNTDLAQIDDEIARVIKANARVFKVFHSWSLAKNRLDLAAKSLDLNFHKVLRSLSSKMLRFHSDRVKLKFVDSSLPPSNSKDHARRKSLLNMGAAEIIRKNFNLAKVSYFTAGGFVIVGSGYTLWATVSEAESEGKELALKVIEAVEDSEEPLTEEQEAALSQAK